MEMQETDVDNYKIVFAGDMTFNEQQLKTNTVGGINMQISKSYETIKKMQNFSQNVTYLKKSCYKIISKYKVF